MRDEDEETRPLRFGASRGDRKPLGQQLRDMEDAYWNDSRRNDAQESSEEISGEQHE